MKLKLSFIFLFFILIFSSFCLSAQGSNVLVVEVTGTIDQYTVEIFKESLKQARSENSEAIILLLDTPGGGLDQTFEIADIINNSEIPFVGYVYPQGSAAWSAGTFILLSCHIAAMADFTIIGSAQPVEITVEGSKLVTDSKRINALVSWIETRAEMRNRNKTIAAKFITENLNVNGTSALDYEVIEHTSPSIDKLLIDINGSTVITSSEEVIINTINAKQNMYSPSIGIQLMRFFSNPILTSLLFMLGIFAIIFGISSPGFGAEVFGVIVIFIIIGCLLLIIEIFATPGFGIIGIGGAICLVIGGIFLIPNYSMDWVISMDWINQAITIIIFVAVLIAIFFIFLLYKIIEVRKKKTQMGTFIGETAKTVDMITPFKPGYVRFKGELWQATSDTTIAPNTKVIIVEKDETTLKIAPK